MKLYNLAIGDFPIDQIFRSVQVFKCRHCGALTNGTYWADRFMGGARVHCPNEKEKWHSRIVGLRHVGLGEVRPKAYEEAVQKEVEEILAANPPKNDLVGDPDLTWEAEAILHEGYVMDGIGFEPHGQKRLVMMERLQPAPFVEEVFERVKGGYTEHIVECVRWNIRFSYEFRIAMREEEERNGRSREGAEAIHRQLTARLGERPLRPEPPTEEESEELQERMGSLETTYRFAYEQWIAEGRLAKIERYRALGIGQQA
jgi:hypothetical protein